MKTIVVADSTFFVQVNPPYIQRNLDFNLKNTHSY